MRVKRALPRVYAALAVLAVLWGVSVAAAANQPARFEYGVPLDPASPWPKFRRDAEQSGRSPIKPADSGAAPWVFQTGNGIFSSPVIDGDGTVYVGSADQYFYAIDHDGHLKWKFPTRGIIDSAALLDDEGRVIFGSGDGHLYALDRASGKIKWAFVADSPEANHAFIRWFEGNVAIGPGGVIFAPNDNFCTYAIQRDKGHELWCAHTWDQTWSLSAFDRQTNSLLIGNNFPFLRNTFALDASTGKRKWGARADGSVVASPLLTTAGSHPMMVVGAFDGITRAYDPSDGRELWQAGFRDHVYASAAEENDGTIIQPGADGTVYALDPAGGGIKWTFDTRAPIRSSPAIDGSGNFYMGSGEGKLFVLNANGTLRWAIKLIDDPRADLNSSPALGLDSIVIGGENGGVFSIPYDYCLRPSNADPRCITHNDEDLPADTASYQYTTDFGNKPLDPPKEIDANQPLTFSLLVRSAGRTELALLDSDSVRVTVEPPQAVDSDVSGDRRFLTVIPKAGFTGNSSGALAVRLHGQYLTGLTRDGARLTGGTPAGTIDRTFQFKVRPHPSSGFRLDPPQHPGDLRNGWDLYRLAAPLPTILPSYNQIGFDSIHYLIGLVEGGGKHAVAWVIGGNVVTAGGRAAPDPGSRVRYPVEIDLDGDALTMSNQAGFTTEFNNVLLPFEFFRIAARVDSSGAAIDHAAINAKAVCGNVKFYGEFLERLGYCNPST
ncbi:MAG TPA: PQQ-binding-like beta-propeller repeat protein, partial [Candidatus Binataceae bacterium]|nr:PQQ-binding-like beta-propeller repeat protein [Candidatus Binataceae bacterium]